MTFKAYAIALVSLSLVSTDAAAFWWLLRAGATRSAAGVGVRSGAAGAAAAEVEAASIASRVCVRPVGALSCDFRTARSTADAASRAVGAGYRVRAADRPNVFEVLDALGNVVSLIESISIETEPSIANAPSYQPDPKIYGMQEYGAGRPISVAPLRHNGDFINLHIGGIPTVVWSDGYMEVWADNGPRRMLTPGERLHFPSQHTVHALPRSPDAYTIFWQPSGTRPNANPNPLSADNCPSGFRMINGRWTCMDTR